MLAPEWPCSPKSDGIPYPAEFQALDQFFVEGCSSNGDLRVGGKNFANFSSLRKLANFLKVFFRTSWKKGKKRKKNSTFFLENLMGTGASKKKENSGSTFPSLQKLQFFPISLC